MRTSNPCWRCLLLFFALSVSVSVPAAEEAVQWSALSADEREVLGPFENKWKTLSPERQQRLRKGAARWQSLDANQRQQFKNRFQKWKNLSPDQKTKIRQRFQRFRALPNNEHQSIIPARRRFQNLPPAQRQRLREKFRNMSPQERQKFQREMRRRQQTRANRQGHRDASKGASGSRDAQQQQWREKHSAEKRRQHTNSQKK